MFTRLFLFVGLIAVFPIKFTLFMHELMWNYVIEYVKLTFNSLRSA